MFVSRRLQLDSSEVKDSIVRLPVSLGVSPLETFLDEPQGVSFSPGFYFSIRILDEYIILRGDCHAHPIFVGERAVKVFSRHVSDITTRTPLLCGAHSVSPRTEAESACRHI